MQNSKRLSSPKPQDPAHQRWRQSLKGSSDCIGTNSFNKSEYLLNPSSWNYIHYNPESKHQQASSAVPSLLKNVASQIRKISKAASMFNLGRGKMQQSRIPSIVLLVMECLSTETWKEIKKKKKKEGEIPKTDYDLLRRLSGVTIS